MGSGCGTQGGGGGGGAVLGFTGRTHQMERSAFQDCPLIFNDVQLRRGAQHFSSSFRASDEYLQLIVNPTQEFCLIQEPLRPAVFLFPPCALA